MNKKEIRKKTTKYRKIFSKFLIISSLVAVSTLFVFWFLIEKVSISVSPNILFYGLMIPSIISGTFFILALVNEGFSGVILRKVYSRRHKIEGKAAFWVGIVCLIFAVILSLLEIIMVLLMTVFWRF